jgi:hypothetical protein
MVMTYKQIVSRDNDNTIQFVPIGDGVSNTLTIDLGDHPFDQDFKGNAPVGFEIPEAMPLTVAIAKVGQAIQLTVTFQTVLPAGESLPFGVSGTLIYKGI